MSEKQTSCCIKQVHGQGIPDKSGVINGAAGQSVSVQIRAQHWTGTCASGEKKVFFIE